MSLEESALTFTGNIPESYDRFLGPVLFEPYARDIARRVPAKSGIQLLEIAAGTGRVTRQLLARLPLDGRLMATDLSPDMVAVGSRLVTDPRVEWRTANALELPFAGESFDAVVIQFGVMFFPDKLQGYREAFRVLRPGGTLLFNAWGPRERNPWVRIAHGVMQRCFAGDTDPLLEKPFSYNDEDKIRATLAEAEFRDVEIEWVSFPFVSETAEVFARGFAMGTPLYDGIRERGGDVEECIALMTDAYRAELGPDPMRTTMTALSVTALK